MKWLTVWSNPLLGDISCILIWPLCIVLPLFPGWYDMKAYLPIYLPHSDRMKTFSSYEPNSVLPLCIFVTAMAKSRQHKRNIDYLYASFSINFIQSLICQVTIVDFWQPVNQYWYVTTDLHSFHRFPVFKQITLYLLGYSI